MGNSSGNYGNVNVKGIMNVVVLSLALLVSVNCSIVVFFPFQRSCDTWAVLKCSSNEVCSVINRCDRSQGLQL